MSKARRTKGPGRGFFRVGLNIRSDIAFLEDILNFERFLRGSSSRPLALLVSDAYLAGNPRGSRTRQARSRRRSTILDGIFDIFFCILVEDLHTTKAFQSILQKCTWSSFLRTVVGREYGGVVHRNSTALSRKPPLLALGRSTAPLGLCYYPNKVVTTLLRKASFYCTAQSAPDPSGHRGCRTI